MFLVIFSFHFQIMDTDSSYGGSDTAQDLSSSTNDNTSSTTTTIDTNNTQSTITIPEESIKITKNNDEISTVYLNVEPTTTTTTTAEDSNQFYHKNEVTLPINYDETDAEIKTNLPHYMSTANLNIESPDDNNDGRMINDNNLEKMNSTFKSTTKLHQQTPKAKKKNPVQKSSGGGGVDNPAFEEDLRDDNNGRVTPKNGNVIRSSFGENKKINGDLNSLSSSYDIPNNNKADEQMTEAVNLELINLKPGGKDVVGPYENGKNGMTSIPAKKDNNEAEMNNPYDEYFVPVNEHRKYMR